MRAVTLAWGVMGVLFATDSVHAQQAPHTHTLSDELNLEFTFTAFAWLTRVNGEATLGEDPVGDEVDLHNGLDLDDHRGAPGATFEILKRDRWRLQFDGYEYSSDSDGVFTGLEQFGSLTINPGDAFDTSLELTSIGAEFGLWIWDPYCIGPLPDGSDCRISVRAGPLAGVRFIDLDHRLTVIGEGTEAAGGEWLAPYAGLQMELRYHLPDSFPLVRWLEVDARGGIGPALGGDGGVLTLFQTSMTAYFTNNFGLGIGYRLVHLNVENDDYEFNGGLQGLIFTATLRF